MSRTEAVNIHIYIVEGDLAGWLVILIGWCLFLPWLALGYTAAGCLGMEKDYGWPIVLVVFISFFYYLAWTSDGFRLLTTVSNYHALWFLGTLGFAITLATCLFTTAYGFAGWVSGIILLGIGWRRSLSTVRAPIRHTVGWLAGLPFSVRELRIHVGASTKLESIRERLSNSVFMLRSFIDDHNTLEEYVWAAPVGSSTGTVNETLERTLSVVASKKGLVLLKLGRSADAEASYAIETTDQDWQTTVAEIDQKCRTIVMVPGSTPGVVWEIERLIEGGNFFNKTLLVFPRESTEAAEMRWNSLRNILAKHQITTPNIPKKRNWDLILVRFMNYGGVEWFIARHNRWANRMSRRAYLWSFSVALDKFVA